MYKAQPFVKNFHEHSRGGGNGATFFNHFPKTFLRQYGRSESVTSQETIFKRIHSRNCEWLCRPTATLSELADTCQSNLETIQLSLMVNSEVVQELIPAYTKLTVVISKILTRGL